MKRNTEVFLFVVFMIAALLCAASEVGDVPMSVGLIAGLVLWVMVAGVGRWNS